MKLKVCGLKNPENIEQISKLDVDFMGFIFFERSKRFVGANLNRSMLNRIPKHIKKVAVFVNERSEDVLWTLKDYEYSFDYIQCHGDETPDCCKDLRNLGFGIIKAFQIDAEFNFDQLEAYKDAVDYYLFDTSSKHYGGSGQKFDWSLLKKYKGNKPFFLSGGIKPEDVSQVQNVSHPQLFAIDINSGFEDEPGLKNSNLIETFSEELKHHS
ncbi:phosphoribosylanthranilate isomerase [Ancylomarina salipaludis]|uniref:N-(5'-phosphoribosyl)anthranilate isomerase n=1 Tax=Ancylomarina salipaludis TaxID=2501299 RepID=A0A4Q1JKP4_9BACT|nr:phosphoribosylanthranilate isomerase [Ancylomarina salipaludis]RXQ93927.1 phosphoribosylanthranilate isomerase [Ancylomarina salipaludis]